MGKMLVSGMNSKHCNTKKLKRDVMVSWLLAEALRDMGHEVEHRNPTMTETYEEFDHVFLGITALHSVGCNRAYGALAALLKTYGQRKITLYIDDVDTQKVMSGLRVMNNDPAKLVKPYYVYRLEYSLATSAPEWHEWLMTGINLLHDYAWPTVIVPMFPWGDIDAIKRGLPNATEVIPIDFSRYVPEYVGEDERSPERERTWLSEADPDKQWMSMQRTRFPTRFFRKGYEKRPEDHGLVLEYAKNWGVIDPGLDNGFFYSRIIYAAQARALFVTKWQNVQALGDPYSLLADKAEEFDDDTRTAWAEAQHTALDAVLWSRDQVKETLSAILKTKVDA